jgi:hypothetical protein
MDWENLIGPAPSAAAKKRTHSTGRGGSKWILPIVTLLGVLAGAGFVGFAVYTFNHSQTPSVAPDASASVAKTRAEESISKGKSKPAAATPTAVASSAATLATKQVKDQAQPDAVQPHVPTVQTPNAAAPSDEAAGDPDAAALTRLLTTDPSKTVAPAASSETSAAPPQTTSSESEKNTGAAKSTEPGKN